MLPYIDTLNPGASCGQISQGTVKDGRAKQASPGFDPHPIVFNLVDSLTF